MCGLSNRKLKVWFCFFLISCFTLWIEYDFIFPKSSPFSPDSIYITIFPTDIWKYVVPVSLWQKNVWRVCSKRTGERLCCSVHSLLKLKSKHYTHMTEVIQARRNKCCQQIIIFIWQLETRYWAKMSHDIVMFKSNSSSSIFLMYGS